MSFRRDKIPTYDREKDGNPFDWIVSQAQKIREERQGRQPEPKKAAAPHHR